jgi:hypothetical protein
MADLNSLSVTIHLQNDAGITSEMVSALENALDHAEGSWRAPEDAEVAREAIRRLWIVVTGRVPETDG